MDHKQRKTLRDISSPRVEPIGDDGMLYVVVRGCGWAMYPEEVHGLRDCLNDAIGDPRLTIAKEEIDKIRRAAMFFASLVPQSVLEREAEMAGQAMRDIQTKELR